MKIFDQTFVTLNLNDVQTPALPVAKDPNVTYVETDNFYKNAVIVPYIQRRMREAAGDVDATGKPSSAAKFSWIKRWIDAWRTA